MPWRSKNRATELLVVRIRCLRSSATVSSKVRSDCSATKARMCSAYRSNGDVLPPRGFGSQHLVSFQHCSHRTAVLGSTSKSSAASRREAPASTASITRLRKSAECDLGIVHPLRQNQCTKTRSPLTPWESRRFKSAGKPSSRVAHDVVGEPASLSPEHAPIAHRGS